MNTFKTSSKSKKLNIYKLYNYLNKHLNCLPLSFELNEIIITWKNYQIRLGDISKKYCKTLVFAAQLELKNNLIKRKSY